MHAANARDGNILAGALVGLLNPGRKAHYQIAPVTSDQPVEQMTQLRELVHGPPEQAAPMADFDLARARATVAGLNGSSFGRTDSAKQQGPENDGNP